MYYPYFFISQIHINVLLLQVICRQIADRLQRMISTRLVAHGTEAYRLTQESLELATTVTNQRRVYTRRLRRSLDRGDGSASR